MKKIFMIAMLSLFLFSCQTRIVNAEKPLKDNTLELYQKYTIQTNDAKSQKIQVLRIDSEKIYGKDRLGNDVVINRNDVHEVKKLDLLPSIGIGVAAILAVIFVPI